MIHPNILSVHLLLQLDPPKPTSSDSRTMVENASVVFASPHKFPGRIPLLGGNASASKRPSVETSNQWMLITSWNTWIWWGGFGWLYIYIYMFVRSCFRNSELSEFLKNFPRCNRFVILRWKGIAPFFTFLSWWIYRWHCIVKLQVTKWLDAVICTEGQNMGSCVLKTATE